VWYFTPFYAILRAVPNKLLGVALMGAAVLLLFFVPWLDRSKVKSIRYRGWLYRSFPVRVRDQFPGARVPGHAAGVDSVHERGAHFRCHLFCVLHSHAVVHEGRSDQAVPDRVTYDAH